MTDPRSAANPRTDIVAPRKPVSWCGDSRARVREFTVDVRRLVGRQLDRVQRGLEPDDWKPMPSIGLGVREIRIQARGHYRVIYLAKFADTVFVLHAFGKKTGKTARGDVDLARRRVREVLRDHLQRRKDIEP